MSVMSRLDVRVARSEGAARTLVAPPAALGPVPAADPQSVPNLSM